MHLFLISTRKNEKKRVYRTKGLQRKEEDYERIKFE